MAKKYKPRKPRAVEVPQSQFSVSLKLGNEILEGKGTTILAALQEMKKPVKIVTKSILTISNGTKTFTRPLTIPLAKRFFMPNTQWLHAKNLSLLMK